MSPETATSEFAGACLCGRVQWVSNASPILQVNCYCIDCRKSTGAAFIPIMFFKADNVTVTGDLTRFSSLGGSGQPIHRGFCSCCGAQVAADVALMPGMITIRAGTLTDIDRFKPSASMFASHAPAWAPPTKDLPSFARLPSGGARPAS